MGWGVFVGLSQSVSQPQSPPQTCTKDNVMQLPVQESATVLWLAGWLDGGGNLCTRNQGERVGIVCGVCSRPCINNTPHSSIHPVPTHSLTARQLQLASKQTNCKRKQKHTHKGIPGVTLLLLFHILYGEMVILRRAPPLMRSEEKEGERLAHVLDFITGNEERGIGC